VSDSVRAARPGLLRDLVLASRPLSWINTAYPFGAAYLMSSGGVDARLVVGTLFFLVPYNLLMYGVNDVFDHESDLRNPRKGGVEGAVLDERVLRVTLWTAPLLAMPFVVWLLAVGSPAAAAVLTVSLFAVLAYSVPGLRFKERPVLDSMTSSTHFVSPALYGLVLSGEPISRSAWLVLAAFFVWGMASQAFGAVQDVMPDRDGGIASIATVLGAARTVRAAIALWSVSGVVLLATSWPGPLAAVLVLPYVALAWPYRSISDERAEAANRGWRQFLVVNYIVGFLVTMLLIGASLTRW
jgi:4-hydroxybenzoate polyprenyltransferase